MAFFFLGNCRGVNVNFQDWLNLKTSIPIFVVLKLLPLMAEKELSHAQKKKTLVSLMRSLKISGKQLHPSFI